MWLATPPWWNNRVHGYDLFTPTDPSEKSCQLGNPIKKPLRNPKPKHITTYQGWGACQGHMQMDVHMGPCNRGQHTTMSHNKHCATCNRGHTDTALWIKRPGKGLYDPWNTGFWRILADSGKNTRKSEHLAKPSAPYPYKSFCFCPFSSDFTVHSLYQLPYS